MDTQEAKNLFDYVEGYLYWKQPGKGRKVGNQVGCKNKLGYYQCKVNGKQWYVHRIIWLWHENNLEDGMQIDHIDRNPSNNKIENLRQVTAKKNRQNNGGKFVRLKTKGKWKWWEAYAPRTGSSHAKTIGCFKTKEEAEAAVACYLEGDSRVGFTWAETH